jgi:hypothetical protein
MLKKSKSALSFMVQLFFITTMLGQGLPKISDIKSPDVGALGLYGKTPVSLSRGSIDVSVPIYNLREGDIKVPISIRYNSTGVKVNQLPGVVGLNWTLNAGGMITRNTKGVPDETKYKSVTDCLPCVRKEINRQDGYFYNSNKLTSEISDDEQLYNFIGNNFENDFEPDEFIFNFNRYSGRFYFSQQGKWVIEGLKGAEITYTLEKRKNNVIVDLIPEVWPGNYLYAVVNTVTYDNIATFKIKTPDGLEYTFGKAESGFSYNRNDTPTDNTAWVLTKIEDPKNENFVEFEYEDKHYLQANLSISFFKDKTTSKTSGLNNLIWGPTTSIVSNNSIKTTAYGGLSWQIKKIKSTNYEIDFEMVESNQLNYDYDAIGIRIINEREDSNASTISSGLDNEIAPVPAYGLNPRPLNNRTRDQLNTITVRSRITNEIIKGFYFDYTNDENKRLYLKMVKENGKNPYEFEYYNEGQLPDYLEEKWLIDHWGYYNNKQSPITDLNFDYRNNDIKYHNSREPDQTYSKYGSLKKVTYPTRGYTIYDYENNRYTKMVNRSVTSGTSFPLLSHNEKIAGGLRIKTIKNYSNSNELSNLKEFSYEEGILPFLPIYLIPDNSYASFSGTRKTGSIFSSSTIVPLQDYGNIPVQYSKVTELIKDTQNNSNGKVEYQYTNYDSYSDVPFSSTFSPNLSNVFPSTINDKARGNLLSKKVFNKSNSIVEEEINVYSKNARVFSKVYAIKNNYYWSQSQGRFSQGAFYTITLNPYNLTKKETKKYSNGTVLTESKNYEYDHMNYLKRTLTTNSNSETEIKKFSYVNDLKVNHLHNDFIRNLGVSRMIQSSDWKNNKYTSGHLETFKKDQHNNIVLDKFFQYEKTSSKTNNGSLLYPTLNSQNVSIHDIKFKDKVTYNLFDSKGNLIQYTIKNAKSVFQLWGYNGENIVATIEGDITKNQVKTALTQVNSSYNSLEVDFGNNEQTLITVFNGLRQKLPKANITSYTYKHGIGISTITDANGMTSYYEYEANKLKQVLDKDKKILKKYEYNYKDSDQYTASTVNIKSLSSTGSLTVNNNELQLNADMLDNGSGKITYTWTIQTQNNGSFIYKTKVPQLKKEIINEYYPIMTVTCHVFDHYSFKSDSVSKSFNIIRINPFFDANSTFTNYLVKGGSGKFEYKWRIENNGTLYGWTTDNVREHTSETGALTLIYLEGHTCYNTKVILGVTDLATGLKLHSTKNRFKDSNAHCPTEDPIPPDCFIAGTKITMSDGTLKNIEDVKVGDNIKTFNIDTKKLEEGEVLEFINPIKNNFIEIKFENGIKNTNTLDHPYYVKDKGWSSYDPKLTNINYRAKTQILEVDDIVIMYKNSKVEFTKIKEITEIRQKQKVFNLKKVSKNHNYFANGILVHNKSKN